MAGRFDITGWYFLLEGWDENLWTHEMLAHGNESRWAHYNGDPSMLVGLPADEFPPEQPIYDPPPPWLCDYMGHHMSRGLGLSGCTKGEGVCKSTSSAPSMELVFHILTFYLFNAPSTELAFDMLRFSYKCIPPQVVLRVSSPRLHAARHMCELAMPRL